MMRLLILTNKKSNAYGAYLLALLPEVVAENVDASQVKNGNGQIEKIKQNPKNEIITREYSSSFISIFHSFFLQYFLRKQKIEMLVQFADKSFISTGLPQLIIPLDPERFIIKKKLPASAKILVSSNFEKQKIIETYGFIESNICVIPASANASFHPISWSEKQAVKMQYTQGKEYFYVNPNGLTEPNFTLLLKAFSAFKKWQHSSMKLVVNGWLSFSQNKEWIEKMNTYRYREDVVFIDNRDSQQPIDLLAATYVFIHLPLQDNDVIPLLQAMQCETPCISFFTDVIKEYTDDAAALIDSKNYDQLSDKMILLYKDETLRNKLIEEGKKQANLYTRNTALQALTRLLQTRHSLT